MYLKGSDRSCTYVSHQTAHQWLASALAYGGPTWWPLLISRSVAVAHGDPLPQTASTKVSPGWSFIHGSLLKSAGDGASKQQPHSQQLLSPAPHLETVYEPCIHRPPIPYICATGCLGCTAPLLTSIPGNLRSENRSTRKRQTTTEQPTSETQETSTLHLQFLILHRQRCKKKLVRINEDDRLLVGSRTVFIMAGGMVNPVVHRHWLVDEWTCFRFRKIRGHLF